MPSSCCVFCNFFIYHHTNITDLLQNETASHSSGDHYCVRERPPVTWLNVLTLPSLPGSHHNKLKRLRVIDDVCFVVVIVIVFLCFCILILVFRIVLFTRSFFFCNHLLGYRRGRRSGYFKTGGKFSSQRVVPAGFRSEVPVRKISKVPAFWVMSAGRRVV
jgi:hypothetical protein